MHSYMQTYMFQISQNSDCKLVLNAITWYIAIHQTINLCILHSGLHIEACMLRIYVHIFILYMFLGILK